MDGLYRIEGIITRCIAIYVGVHVHNRGHVEHDYVVHILYEI